MCYWSHPDLLHIRSDHFSEKQLAEIALAIQNRWEVPTFVKMHEIVVVDEDIEERARHELLKQFERGFETILSNLELSQAVTLARVSKNKFSLQRIPSGEFPKWVGEIEQANRVPEGMYECPHCVLPNTLILGDNKQIIEYKIGDTAVGLTGLSNVVRTFSRPYEGEVVMIKASGMLPLTTTLEHPVLSCFSHSIHYRVGKKLRNEVLFSEGRWFAAECLVPKDSQNDGNYLVVPIIKGTFEEKLVTLSPFVRKHKPKHTGYRNDLPLNVEIAWLLGLYVATGSIAKELRFSLGSHATTIRRRIYRIAKDMGYSAYTPYSSTANSMLVAITSRVLARAFHTWCGHGASNKKIPDFILFHKDESLVRAFLEGYEVGDGYVATNKHGGNKKYMVCSTTSKLLVQQLQLAHARLRKWASISIKREKSKDVILGRKVALDHTYNISYPIKSNSIESKVRFIDDRILSPIRSVTKKSYRGNVCNLETTGNTYLVSNAVVHNCGKWLKSELELSMHTKLHYLA
jgi:hypothetical protein